MRQIIKGFLNNWCSLVCRGITHCSTVSKIVSPYRSPAFFSSEIGPIKETVANSDRASSEIVGQSIILGLTVMSISIVSLYGLPMIYGLQDMVNGINAEQTFALFESNANQAILGELPKETININLGRGSLAVEPNGTGKESYITIKREKESDVIELPMGKMTLRLGNRVISYEAGGVWSDYGSGGSRMLSPPMFYYDGTTLTLPGVGINGGSAEVKGIASVTFEKNASRVLYPNTTCAGCANRTNPLNSGVSGDIYVNITSDFYEAWADHISDLGFTQISKNPETHTASIKLSSVPTTLGGSTPITNPINLRGLDPGSPYPLNNFSFRLVPYGDAFDWDIHASSGKKKLIYHINGDAKAVGSKADLNVGYQDDGPGYNKPAETWKGKDVLTVQGQDGNLYLDVNLLDAGTKLSYSGTDVGAGAFGIYNKDFNSSNFSWYNNATAPYTTPYKWIFKNDNESWKFNISGSYSSGGRMNFTSADGNSSGSIYSKLVGDGAPRTATFTLISPEITWSNGTPDSASFSFDWKVATYGSSGSFYVILVKPNGSTQIFPTTPFNTTTGWLPMYTSIAPSEFSENGNYTLKLIAVLNTKLGALTEEVRWDNPTLTLTSSGSGSSQLTNKSLFDITRHYIGKMAQEEDLSFYQGYQPGKQPAAESTVLLNYSSTKAPIYLFVSQNTVDVDVRT